jgi:GTP pyrophosphokinase
MSNQLTDRIKAYLPEGDFALLEKAYEFSSQAHHNQHRASGEDFFTHCTAVAEILTDLKLDIPTIAASLLHDVLEDTAVPPQELRRLFGVEITSMVEGLTKISAYHFPDAEIAQAENWRKMLLAVTKDIRVILIKLADRLHNLRTIGYLPPEKQRSIAAESLNLYAPFAQRLGIYRWKSEIEDLSFAILEPEAYRSIREAWEQREESDARNLTLWQNALQEHIGTSGIPFRMSARPKSLYGVHQKMKRLNKEFGQIQDLLGLRLITDTVANCYGLLGLVQSHFKPFPGSFDDYISMPKINMYQSLHLAIFGPRNLLAELQIRTEEMHRRAEFGIAAHWRYKEKGGSRPADPHKAEEIEEKLDWLKQVLEWQQELTDAKEFLQAFKAECKFEQIFVFTPRGKVLKLPQGATPIDFAYAVHTEIGHHCFGAKVGGKMVPLDFALKSGEICDILVRRNAQPNKHWLETAITARARAKIRKYLRNHSGAQK